MAFTVGTSFKWTPKQEYSLPVSRVALSPPPVAPGWTLHGEVQVDAFGKVGNQVELGHGADVVLEAGTDHLLQFGALLTGGDLLGGQHHAGIGNPGGKGAGRFIQ